jgi:hypothetical protein
VLRVELARFGAEAGLADVIEAWPAAVGDVIARNAWPARIARDGTLHVHTADSVWAFELGHRAAEIAGRLGVAKVRFAVGPLPSHEPSVPAASIREPSPDDLRAAAALAAAIGDENLRETVQKAAGFWHARAAARGAF